MEITLSITILSALVTLVAVAGVWTERASLSGHAINASWLGLVACFVGIYAEVFYGAGPALAAAAFAALAVTPVDIKDARARQTAHGVSGSIALTLAAGAIMISANTFYKPLQVDPNLILLAGHWSAMAAALASMAGAASMAGWDKSRGFSSAGAGVVVAGMALGALLLATHRADIALHEYLVPLSSDGAHVRWALPGLTGGAKAFGFEVTQVVPGAKVLAIITAILAVFAGGVGFFKEGAIKAWAWLGAAGGAVVTLGVILNTGFKPRLPDQVQYYEHARTMASARGIPDRVLSMGSFDNGDNIYVLWLDILPDCLMFGGAALLAVLFFKLSKVAVSDVKDAVNEGAPAIRVSPEPVDITRFWARDLAVKGAAFAMLAWMLSLLLSWRMDAVYGFGAPVEWVMLGAAIATVGAVVAAWREEKGVVASVLYGVSACGLLLAAVTATL